MPTNVTLGTMCSSTIFISQEGPANSLALNKDSTQVVIAGRNVFKVFSIDANEFTEVYNLRVGKNLNLNFSSNDVAWSSLEENILATAATNGAVVIWNLSRASRSKQEHVFMDHKRTVNKVTFHLTEPHWLLSASQDGTMKCFDLRNKEVASTFHSNAESVRDVQFNPQSPNVFAGVSENGNVQLWDIRKNDKCIHQFAAHSGPVFACDWHTESPWLATASRDKTIKIWDIQGKPSLEFTIHTIASVGHVKWRPQKKYHLTSCALVLDSNVNIWDIRRPHLPFAIFGEHKDVTTAVAWTHDPDVFLSTSRDCTLYRHMFKDAAFPIMAASPQGISISVKGEIAFCDKKTLPGEKYLSPLIRKKPLPLPETFHLAASTVQEFPGFPDSSFAECAKQYILSGRSFVEMCDHNANVAKNIGKHQVGAVWDIIKTLYEFKSMTQNQDNCNSSNISTSNRSDDPHSNIVGIGTAPSGSGSNLVNLRGTSSGIFSGSDSTCIDTAMPQDQRSRSELIQSNTFSNIIDDDSDGEDGMSEHFQNSGVLGIPTQMIHIPKGPPPVDKNAPGTADGKHRWLTARHAHYVDLSAQDWTLQSEAFPLRTTVQGPTHMQDIQSTASSSFAEPDQSAESVEVSGITFTASISSIPPFYQQNSTSSLNSNMTTTNTTCSTSPQSSTMTTVEDQPSSILTVTSSSLFPAWDPTQIVADALKLHAEFGDVQTSVSVLLVLGDLRNTLNPYIDEVTQEHWLNTYLEMLARHKLWNVSTLIIQGAWINSIAQLNQQSTVVHTNCSKCNKELTRCGWLCDKCNSADPGRCSLCHQIVKGLYMWCQGCSHGGHLEHMQQWLANRKECPTGCGHICKYS